MDVHQVVVRHVKLRERDQAREVGVQRPVEAVVGEAEACERRVQRDLRFGV